MRKCDVEGCENKHKGHGYCKNHLTQAYNTGKLQKQSCSVDDCTRPLLANGVCRLHNDRIRYSGTATVTIVRVDSPEYKQSNLTYKAAHKHVYKERGKASEWHCVECGKSARHWALIHGRGTQHELGGHSHKMQYSTNVWDYWPMCTKCHVRYDTTNS